MQLKTAGLTPTPSGAQWSPESVAVGAFPHAAAVHGWNTGHGFDAFNDPEWRDSSLSPTREFMNTSMIDQETDRTSSATWLFRYSICPS
jgi:hypothetical protein